MVKKYKITYTTEGSEASPKTGHIDSFFLQFRIKDLADTVFVGWAVEVLGDIGDNVTKESYFPQDDGEAVEIDAKWGLNKRRHATAGLMARLNELWQLIERTNVHKVTFPVCIKDEISVVTEYTNDLDYVKRIKFIKKWLREWTCDLIHLKNQDELAEVQPSKELIGRIHDVDNADDEDDECGDRGWITAILCRLIEKAEESARREEARFKREEARLRREEAQGVRHIKYFVKIDGRMQLKEGYTNSSLIISNIYRINSKIANKSYFWKIYVLSIEDGNNLSEVQNGDGGCIRAREKGNDYGDKVDDIHEVDVEWYNAEGEDESYVKKYYEAVWVTRDLLIAQNRALRQQKSKSSKKTRPSTEKGDLEKERSNHTTEKTDFKRENEIRVEEGTQHVLWWLKRQG